MATDKTLQQYEAVRRSGKTNMLSIDTVQVIAYECDYHSLVTFIEDHSKGEYLEMAQMAAEFYRGEELNLVDELVPDTITREVTF